MKLRLIQKGHPNRTLDAKGLLPSRWNGMNVDQVENTELGDSLGWRIGDYFSAVIESDTKNTSDASRCISGPDDRSPSDTLVIQGNLSSFENVGHGLTSEAIIVHGDVGDHCGSEMKGGLLVVIGNVGKNAASSIAGGLFAVSGNVGDRLAGPSPGKLAGMRGGDVLVGGCVGDQAMERMRRGTVIIGQDAGSHGCANMIAGTVIGLGSIGDRWCVGMKRGTVILSQPPKRWNGCRLSSSRHFEMSFLPLIWRHLARTCRWIDEQTEWAGVPGLGIHSKLPTSRWVDRQVGDLDRQGVGEVLVLQRLADAAK